jgi:UDPglucose--hexose-1-phosphate uridylyltransferase
MDLQFDTHNRYNPLLGEWVKVSPHRTKRPWNGQVEKPHETALEAYDPTCYLCPNNLRSGGIRNPDYQDVYVFDNDFASLLEDTPSGEQKNGPHGLLTAHAEKGRCRVVCFSPRHDLTLSRMEIPSIMQVISVWKHEYESLGALQMINYVQIFENRGAIMGCSNPHPHSQIWSEEIIPDIPTKELQKQKEYYQQYGSAMLLDYARYETDCKERIIHQDAHFIAVVPFWAVWPFEALIIPSRRGIQSLSELTAEETESLARTMQQLGIRYDNLFETSFPYSMGIHQLPTDAQPYPGSMLHLHYFPPLLRSASVKKFMVGYEMMAMPQRDITAEKAAQMLRTLNSVHYSQGGN